MECTSTCERFNPYGCADVSPIVNESDLISSSPYLFTVIDELSRPYQIVSDYNGIMLPYVFFGDNLAIGTSNYIYYIDRNSKKTVKQIKAPSLCVDICLKQNLIIVICETDIVLLSESKKTEYNFGDVISDFALHEEFFSVTLEDGTRRELKIN